ncbi:RNA methyltransferase [Candidatus Dojkabacteria bacterium]|nr:RNA methyltransferase [Candidatus Dojkabacteria bacterium]
MITPKRKQRIKDIISQRQKGLTVIFEDIYDPHNAAAVLRTCDGFGIQKVCFIFDKQKSFNPRKIGKVSSSSANKWLDFYKYKSTHKCYEDLREKGYKIIATILDEESENIFTSSFTEEKLALVFGNEHTGLSKSARKLADRKLHIPMNGFVQSLNLSVTAAICIFEVTRQRLNLKNKTDFTISKNRQRELYEKFIEK